MKTKEAGKQLEKLVKAADEFISHAINSDPVDIYKVEEFRKVVEETRPAIKVLKNRFP